MLSANAGEPHQMATVAKTKTIRALRNMHTLATLQSQGHCFGAICMPKQAGEPDVVDISKLFIINHLRLDDRPSGRSHPSSSDVLEKISAHF
jgi:hypothetical protein